MIFRNLGQLRAPEALFGWVRAIAVREAVRVARRRGTHSELTELPASGDPQLAVDVGDVLGRLSADLRAILVLRSWKASASNGPPSCSPSRSVPRSLGSPVPATVSGRSGSHD
ncbi:MAG: hypothetical protein ACR2JG_06405 [Geodermatophilaceae bacterium]